MKKVIGVAVVLATAAGLLVTVALTRLPASTNQVAEVSSTPKTSLQRIVDSVNEDGLTKESALAAFSAQRGPLPGVTLPPSDEGATDNDFSGTMTLGWMRQHWDEYTDEQRDAIQQLVGDGTGAEVAVEGEGRDSGERSPRSTGTTQRKPKGRLLAAGRRVSTVHALPREQSTANGSIAAAAATLSAKLGQPSPPILTQRADRSGDLYAEASSWRANGAVFKTSDNRPACMITLFSKKLDTLSNAASMQAVLAHEVFHCFQFAAVGFDEARRNAVPQWVQEGEASWAMNMLYGAGSAAIPKVAGAGDTWVKTPERDLPHRDYDGVGFFGLLGDVIGVQDGVWVKLLPAVQAGPGAYDSLTKGYEQSILEYWGSSYFRIVGRAQWDMRGPGLPGSSVTPLPIGPVPDGSEANAGPDHPFTAGQYTADVTADLATIRTASGGGRVADASFGFDQPLKVGGSPLLCFKPNGCKCPDSEEEIGVKAVSPLKLGISGGKSAGWSVVQGLSLDSFCKEKKIPKPAPKPVPRPVQVPAKSSCNAPAKGNGGPGTRTTPTKTNRSNQPKRASALRVRRHQAVVTRVPSQSCSAPSGGGCQASCGGSNGDPHLATFDGVRYELQAVGEFTMVKSTTDRFEVQARQAPLAGSRSVSVNSSVGVRVGDHKLTITAGPGGLELRQDGQPKRIDEIGLDDAEVQTQVNDGGTGYVVALDDGTKVYALPIDAAGINLQIELGKDRKGKIEGLLGNSNEDRSDDLVADGGRRLGEKPKDDDIYGPLADRWRVRQPESVLDYGDRESTDTFTDRTFPDTHLDPKSIPNRAELEAVCRAEGISDERVLDACIIDVYQTGSVSYAAAMQVDQHIEDATKRQRRRTKGGTFQDRIDEPETVVSHTFEADADELISIGGEGDDCKDNGMALLLRGPDGKELRTRTGCQFGRIQLPATGTYTMLVNATKEYTGEYRIPLVPIRPDIVRDGRLGDELRGHIDQRPEHDVFRLQVNGGETLHADRDNCVDNSIVVDILNPAGNSVVSTNACLLEDVQLLQPGTYLVVVNAQDNATGDYRFRLLGD